jgi:hypothetical protein
MWRVNRFVLSGSLLVSMVSGCASEGSAPAPTTAAPATDAPAIVTVAPDPDAPEYVVSVSMTDDGYDPHTLFLPAGRQVRLVLRNRGETEHHYRVVGLDASEIRWYLYPEMTEDEVIAMEGGDVDDVEHVMHHLTPQFVPFRQESLAEIRPLSTEVHGYAEPGGHDVVLFYPTSVGSFAVQDVFHPAITGKVVVFDPGG